MRNSERASRWVWIAAVAIGICGAARVAYALYASTTVVYSGATLAASTARIDTVVVSDASNTRQSKPSPIQVEFSGTSQAAAADSQCFATVRTIRGGHVQQIGADSLCLRPDVSANAQSGEVRLMRWVSDSLQVTSHNPKSTTGTGWRLAIITERE